MTGGGDDHRVAVDGDVGAESVAGTRVLRADAGRCDHGGDVGGVRPAGGVGRQSSPDHVAAVGVEVSVVDDVDDVGERGAGVLERAVLAIVRPDLHPREPRVVDGELVAGVRECVAESGGGTRECRVAGADVPDRDVGRRRLADRRPARDRVDRTPEPGTGGRAPEGEIEVVPTDVVPADCAAVDRSVAVAVVARRAHPQVGGGQRQCGAEAVAGCRRVAGRPVVHGGDPLADRCRGQVVDDDETGVQSDVVVAGGAHGHATCRDVEPVAVLRAGGPGDRAEELERAGRVLLVDGDLGDRRVAHREVRRLERDVARVDAGDRLDVGPHAALVLHDVDEPIVRHADRRPRPVDRHDRGARRRGSSFDVHGAGGRSVRAGVGGRTDQDGAARDGDVGPVGLTVEPVDCSRRRAGDPRAADLDERVRRAVAVRVVELRRGDGAHDEDLAVVVDARSELVGHVAAGSGEERGRAERRTVPRVDPDLAGVLTQHVAEWVGDHESVVDQRHVVAEEAVRVRVGVRDEDRRRERTAVLLDIDVHEACAGNERVRRVADHDDAGVRREVTGQRERPVAVGPLTDGSDTDGRPAVQVVDVDLVGERRHAEEPVAQHDALGRLAADVFAPGERLARVGPPVHERGARERLGPGDGDDVAFDRDVGAERPVAPCAHGRVSGVAELQCLAEDPRVRRRAALVHVGASAVAGFSDDGPVAVDVDGRAEVVASRVGPAHLVGDVDERDRVRGLHEVEVRQRLVRELADAATVTTRDHRIRRVGRGVVEGGAGLEADRPAGREQSAHAEGRQRSGSEIDREVELRRVRQREVAVEPHELSGADPHRGGRQVEPVRVDAEATGRRVDHAGPGVVDVEQAGRVVDGDQAPVVDQRTEAGHAGTDVEHELTVRRRERLLDRDRPGRRDGRVVVEPDERVLGDRDRAVDDVRQVLGVTNDEGSARDGGDTRPHDDLRDLDVVVDGHAGLVGGEQRHVRGPRQLAEIPVRRSRPVDGSGSLGPEGVDHGHHLDGEHRADVAVVARGTHRQRAAVERDRRAGGVGGRPVGVPELVGGAGAEAEPVVAEHPDLASVTGTADRDVAADEVDEVVPGRGEVLGELVGVPPVLLPLGRRSVGVDDVEHAERVRIAGGLGADTADGDAADVECNRLAGALAGDEDGVVGDPGRCDRGDVGTGRVPDPHPTGVGAGGVGARSAGDDELPGTDLARGDRVAELSEPGRRGAAVIHRGGDPPATGVGDEEDRAVVGRAGCCGTGAGCTDDESGVGQPGEAGAELVALVRSRHGADLDGVAGRHVVDPNGAGHRGAGAATRLGDGHEITAHGDGVAEPLGAHADPGIDRGPELPVGGRVVANEHRDDTRAVRATTGERCGCDQAVAVEIEREPEPATGSGARDLLVLADDRVDRDRIHGAGGIDPDRDRRTLDLESSRKDGAPGVERVESGVPERRTIAAFESRGRRVDEPRHRLGDGHVEHDFVADRSIDRPALLEAGTGGPEPLGDRTTNDLDPAVGVDGRTVDVGAVDADRLDRGARRPRRDRHRIAGEPAGEPIVDERDRGGGGRCDGRDLVGPR